MCHEGGSPISCHCHSPPAGDTLGRREEAFSASGRQEEAHLTSSGGGRLGGGGRRGRSLRLVGGRSTSHLLTPGRLCTLSSPPDAGQDNGARASVAVHGVMAGKGHRLTNRYHLHSPACLPAPAHLHSACLLPPLSASACTATSRWQGKRRKGGAGGQNASHLR